MIQNQQKERTKNLSSIADDVLQRCSLKLKTSVSVLVKDFDSKWKGEKKQYSRKLVEYCSSKALYEICKDMEQTIREGTFSRLSFDMMLAWEKPACADEQAQMEKEEVKKPAKEKEDKKKPANSSNKQDDIPLFYSDIMPLLVNNKPNVGEDAFVWLGSLVPLVADFINGKFTFETLTSSTQNRLHYPAYEKFLQEIAKCVQHLQKQATPRNVEMADDEFILHVEGTATSQRVIRHIGKQSWPGRLTLTNYALYFEASGSMTYEDAFKLDLSKDINHSIKPAATGPFGAPLFDKAIVYESAELEDGFQIEFPELTSCTRRDHWLALVNEIMLLHKFLSKFKVESPLEAWEMHARTILGIIRLHAAREMLRISPPNPKNFLIFALFDELPTGSNVLHELAESLKSVKSGHPCSASSILRNLNVSTCIPCAEEDISVEQSDKNVNNQPDNLLSLETAVDQVREEAKEINSAKATADELKEDGIGDSALVLMELMKPLKNALPWFQEVIEWKNPTTTATVMSTSLLVVYKEWVGKAIAAFLLWLVSKMIWARKYEVGKQTKFVVCNNNDQTAVDSIVAAQHGINTIYNILQSVNVSLLKIRSIWLANAPKHTNTMIVVMIGCAVILLVIPLKYIIMSALLSTFAVKLNPGDRRDKKNIMGNQRLKGWWDSIPVSPVEVVQKAGESPKESGLKKE
ncbi:uncharacterized protein LOC111887438 isoform X2 [Lactuca sativa]|uniref:uncharacterized protein LOC111887438 isoform X2 n=1 Tax=Lactuca sativa TaxID=4236 RepID=UPI000CD8A022|nr:uncharacterized protein LOC111887438 isoform X2 [Lactuca sativa]